MNQFTVELNADAQNDLREIKDVRTRRAIINGLSRLEMEPAKRGKVLGGDLQGRYSIRLAGQRYRALYDIAVSQGVVTILVIALRREGSRQDVYEIARRRVDRE